MKAREALTLAVWFAACDLFERQVRRTTRTMIVTLFSVTLFLVAAFGLAFGFGRARQERLRASPESLCLLVGNPIISDEITPDLLKRISQRLKKSKVSSGAQLMPFHILDNVYWNSVPEGVGARRMAGRTIAETDPLLRTLQRPGVFQSQVPEDSRSKLQGVIITEKMQVQLGLPLDQRAPATLWANSGAGEPQAVTILGITSVPVLDGHQFIVPEPYLEEFLAAIHSRPRRRIRIGPMPDELCDIEFRNEFSDNFGDQMLALGLTRRIGNWKIGDRAGWKIELNIGKGVDGLTSAQWVKVIEELKTMSPKLRDAIPNAAHFMFPEESEMASYQLPDSYDDLAVYVDDIDRLRPVMNAILAADDPSPMVSEDKVRQAEEIDATTQTVIALLSIVSLVIVGIASINLYTILVLRAEQQIGEIGMLKAMGMGRSLLKLIYVVQGVLLWAISVPLGVVVGLLMGSLVAWGCCWATGDPYRLWFYLPWEVVLGVLTGNGLLCVCGTHFSTRQARESSPNRCLQISL